MNKHIWPLSQFFKRWITLSISWINHYPQVLLLFYFLHSNYIKEIRVKIHVLSGNYVFFCLASHGNLTTGEIAYRIVLSCCVTGESQKMMPEEHSSWQEAMPSTLLLCLLHGLNLSCY